MKETVRIGGAGGFWGDTPAALAQLVTKGDVDYIVNDYLAELTMAIMAKMRTRDPAAGFATDFVTLALRPVLRDVAAKGIRIVTNAGGINPRGCADALRELCADAGVPLRIAIVEGDDLLPHADDLRRRGVAEMFTGEPLPAKPVSINAYLGAFPIAAALDAGADIVVTGRCADSALTLAPLIHEFGWKPTDFDRLAAGSMAGHLLECGTQTTGGLFTDWESVPGRADMGYPVAVCYPDGTFDITKPPVTGGLVTPLVAAEQMLYEVGDPRNYLLPDVTCDLSRIRIDEVGENVVRFTGVKGRAPTGTYKVSAIHQDGYRCSATLTMVGRNAAGKARLIGEAIIERCRAMLRASNLGDFQETGIEALGSEAATFGAHARDVNPREVVLRVSVRHAEKEAINIFGREIAPFGTGGTPGTTGFSGRPKPQEIFRLFSFLVDKDHVAVSVELDGETVPFEPVDVAAEAPAPPGDPVQSVALEAESPHIVVPLRDIAVARSGDKADISHLAVIARTPAFYPVLLAELTEARLTEHFRHLVRGRVERHDVPGIHALNFLLHEALGGGGTASLRSDALGKAFGEIVLDMEVRVPAVLLGRTGEARAA